MLNRACNQMGCLVGCWVVLGSIPLSAQEIASREPAGREPPSAIDFAQDIRPLLSDRCFACHGPDEQQRQSELRVDNLQSLLEDRGGYQVIAPGNTAESELLRRIEADDESEIMPPPETGKPLTPAERELLRQWIAEGAPWQQHWAYTPPRWHNPPQLTDAPAMAAQTQNWVDRFIAAKLLQHGGTFSAAAERTTLARRLSFDLTGLPPSTQALEEFLADDSPAAVPQYVERLLASPAFGERLAAYWLDLVRFADTVGYHGDQDHHISPYRDYVIDAFNDNLPFDQFTCEQLAGDLLPAPTEEQIIATGYNRMLQTSHEGGVQPKEYLAIYAADRVRNLSAVWMGATVGCAQCHDHKFDPYTARDFYALSAFFADIDEAQHFTAGADAIPTKRPPERAFLSRRERLQLAAAEQELKGLLAARSSTSRATTESSEAAEVVEPTEVAEPSELETRIAAAEKRIADIQSAARLSMITVSIPPRTVRFLPRGNWLDDSGDPMSPAIPEFMQPPTSDRPSPANRLELAQWLVDAERGNGLLTARVFVNRLWLLLFGQGLSRSVEDFGGQGEAPSHPQLLDCLAVEFVRSGWDIKHMLRLLTASRTYQQSSLEGEWHRAHDPQNRWLGRQNRYRISAEMVRDTALSCGQLLVHKLGGASIKPYQPENYYRHLNFPKRTYQASTDGEQWRRGVYIHWQRQFLHPMLRAFDATSREECTAQRPQSNTPLAALVSLNDPSLLEAARGLAYRVLQQSAADEQRLEAMFQIATSRLPDATEREELRKLLQQSRDYFAAHPERQEQFLSVGLWQLEDPPRSLELATWTTAARAVLNLNETFTRN